MTQQILDRPGIDYSKAHPANSTHPPLTAADRCDGVTDSVKNDGAKVKVTCGAQAFVRVILPSGLDLLFCGHCLGEQTLGKSLGKSKSNRNASNRAKLVEMGAQIDNSAYASINLKPSNGSGAKGF